MCGTGARRSVMSRSVVGSCGVLGRWSGVGAGLRTEGIGPGSKQNRRADQQSHRYEEPLHPTTAVNRQHTASG
jgi:hypothetical protein